MKRTGVEQVIAEHLLTGPVLEHLVAAGEPSVDEGALVWRSWPQTFESTAGPWNGIGGAAMTQFQVTVAVDRSSKLVLVFVASDLYAYGWTEVTWFWDQYLGSNINTRRLADHGLTVLGRPLRSPLSSSEPRSHAPPGTSGG